ncbi:pentapeptide repeat-containing protein [Celeribacter litoreus]|uniref:pentapeptide repeat-containing protein n=1 Tax=Celeribacter litoreus TaxID=2876714 RepID=UPI001CCDED65|nr:pentapeptide repeat-containing protein [Celeribacter litoreus]MCA0045240.1 pentapeptide repeat-containing protein [Celeribacter litoreus]
MFTALYTIFGTTILLVIILLFLWQWRQPSWMGFRGRTLWDWLEIFTIPAYLGIASLVLGFVQLELAGLRAEEAAFQTYLDRISDTDLSNPDTHAIVRAQTSAVLTQVTGARSARVLRVLSELEAIHIARPDLEGHDLRRTELKGLDLRGLNFEEAKLKGADFEGALLQGSNFEDADLRGADFKEANLTDVDFSGANLRNASLARALVTNANFESAKNVSDDQWAKTCDRPNACMAHTEDDDD